MKIQQSIHGATMRRGDRMKDSYKEKLKEYLVQDLAAYLHSEIEAMLGKEAADKLIEYRAEIASKESA